MCLYKLSRIPWIALRDKVVYKLVLKDNNLYKIVFKNNNVYKTYVQESIIEIGKTYKGIFLDYSFDYTIIKDDKIYHIKSKLLAFLYSLFISETLASGYIHSFDNERNARNYIYDNYIHKTKIIKCIIPKGTLYFIGNGHDLASRKLKYVEEIY